MIVFLTGGVRSGKSDTAQKWGEGMEGRRLYLATAEALDDEMRRRIARHQMSRADRWTTWEEPVHIGTAIERVADEYDVILIDCLTVWVSNLLHYAEGDDELYAKEVNALLKAMESLRGTVFIVSNEVGMGIVPDNACAREYRDRLGLLNQRIAQKADRVYFICSGIPLVLKDGNPEGSGTQGNNVGKSLDRPPGD